MMPGQLSPMQIQCRKCGDIGHDRIMVSLENPIIPIKGSKIPGKTVISDEAMLGAAGHLCGNKVDKSEMFQFHTEGTRAPVIDEAPVVMDCTVDDIYETEGFESFICKIDGVYAEENVLNEEGKINYHELKPVLFEMPTYEYLRTGDVIGKCMNLGK